MNLFLSTRALTDSAEDHMTEFFAAALEHFPHVRSRYFEIAIAGFASTKGWGSCEIKDIETQHCYEDESCIPDMLLTLSNGKLVLCEHKLDSPETPGSEVDERPQLQRYLDLPVDGLLYVRSAWQPPETAVLIHPKYIKPRDREHFLWRDFFPLFENASEPFLLWLKEGFERLGFTPPHPRIGELDSDSERQNFAKLWSKTRSYAHRLGWSSSPGAVVQLYFDSNVNALADLVFIQPTSSGFQFRATPKKEMSDRCFRRLSDTCASRHDLVFHGARMVRRKEGRVAVYDIELSADAVLGKHVATAAEVEDKLYEFVAGFLDVLQDG